MSNPSSKISIPPCRGQNDTQKSPIPRRLGQNAPKNLHFPPHLSQNDPNRLYMRLSAYSAKSLRRNDLRHLARRLLYCRCRVAAPTAGHPVGHIKRAYAQKVGVI